MRPRSFDRGQRFSQAWAIQQIHAGQKMKRFFGAQDERDTKVGQEKKFGHAYQRAQVSRRFPLSHHSHEIFQLAQRLTKTWAIIRFAQGQKMKSFVEAQGEQVHFGAEDEQGMKVCREKTLGDERL